MFLLQFFSIISLKFLVLKLFDFTIYDIVAIKFLNLFESEVLKIGASCNKRQLLQMIW